MTETREIRIKRLSMRSWRRGTREMDLILGGFADSDLAGLEDAAMDAYEALLEENDWDLYYWVTGARVVPDLHRAMIDLLRQRSGITD
ncbi:MAG TPA: succinate dehydrogenase assembly factor 2 [Thermohalobaculum sp.]|nr:succinate dehydrogenase assembly factor 2 [Thermohalobaculum sp.]